MLSDLSPAAIGLIAAGVAGAVTVLVQRQKTADDRRAKLSDKLEGLVLAIFEHDSMLDRQRELSMEGKAVPTYANVQPIARAQMLAAIYAPQLLAAVNTYETACITYSSYLLGKALEKSLNSSADMLADFRPAYDTYLTARVTVVNLIQAHIRTLIVEGKL